MYGSWHKWIYAKDGHKRGWLELGWLGWSGVSYMDTNGCAWLDEGKKMTKVCVLYCGHVNKKHRDYDDLVRSVD